MIEKSREIVVVLHFLIFDNFDLTKKLWKTIWLKKNREIIAIWQFWQLWLNGLNEKIFEKSREIVAVLHFDLTRKIVEWDFLTNFVVFEFTCPSKISLADWVMILS